MANEDIIDIGEIQKHTEHMLRSIGGIKGRVRRAKEELEVEE